MYLLLLLIHFGVALTIAVGMIAVSYILGERHQDELTGEPYESGIRPTEATSVTYSPHFYLVAVFFVIFDLEAVFLFSWAVAASQVGWAGYVEMLVFVGVLLAALVYLWRLGALDWGSRPGSKAARQPVRGAPPKEDAAP